MTWHYDDDRRAVSLTRTYKEKTVVATFNEGDMLETEKHGRHLFGANYHEEDGYQLRTHGFIIEEM
jgi:hypothetical protein